MQKKKIRFGKQVVKVLRSNWFVVLSIFIILVLLIKWFNGNYTIAIAEEGLPFYHSIKTFTLYNSLWIENGFGFASPFYIPRLILYGYAATLSFAGIPYMVIQASIFAILLGTPLLAFPVLFNSLYPDKPRYYGYVATLFYVFNLYTLSQVWERFIYPLMFLWSYAPLFLLLWINWHDKKRSRYLLLLLVTSLVYSDAYGLTSSFLTLSFFALSYLVVSLLSKKNIIQKLLYGIGGFSVWCIFQLWWALPIFQLRGDVFGSFLNTANTLRSLEDVSKFFPSSEILLLKQGFYFGSTNFLTYFYDKQYVYVFSIFILLIVVIGIFVSYKSKAWKYIFSLFVVGWFVSKGYNPPFGKEFFTALFTLFPFAQILRNPYEKFGIVFLLPYSMFFAFGVFWLAGRLKRLQWPFIIVISIFTFGLLVWPIWTGDVFTGARITVPHYYEEANTYLNRYDRRRILILPLLKEANIEYQWRYRGEEPSEFLFDRASLSRSDFGFPNDEFYLSFPQYISNKNFSHILSVANISNIVIRKDTIQNQFNQSSIDDYISHVQQWKNVDNGKAFGELIVYSVKKDTINDLLYTVKAIHTAKSVKDGMDRMVSDSFYPKSEAIFVLSQNKPLHIPKVLITPTISFIKHSPARYSVTVKDAKGPYILIFSVSYNSLWRASIHGSELPNHFNVNGFANGWLIGEKGSYTIDLSFLSI
jgi:hypothetical protein